MYIQVMYIPCTTYVMCIQCTTLYEPCSYSSEQYKICSDMYMVAVQSTQTKHVDVRTRIGRQAAARQPPETLSLPSRLGCQVYLEVPKFRNTGGLVHASTIKSESTPLQSTIKL